MLGTGARGLWWLALAASCTGCTAAGAFVCSDDDACGPEGRCEASGYCSFPAAECPSQQRYGEHAPAGLAGTCVDEEPPASSGDAGSTGVSTTLTSSTDPSTSTTTTATTSSTDPTTSSGPSTDPLTITSDGGSSDTADTGQPETTTGGEPLVVGPMVIEDDLDDGTIWPASGMTPGQWLPSGEQPPGLAYMGEYPVGNGYFGYFRFDLPVELPAGTLVTSAVLEIGGHNTWQWTPDADALRVYVQFATDAAQVSGVGDYPGGDDGVVLGQASARWPSDGGLDWNTMGTNTSPDLAASIQELLDAAGSLAAGAHLQLWIACAELGIGNREVGWLDASSGEGARLTLEVLRP